MNVPEAAFEGVTFAYGDGPPVLHDIWLRVGPGEFVALVGANGAGKTTLARHLIGLLRPSKGVVRLDGEDIARWTVGHLARWVGFAFQNPETQIFSPSVREEVAFGPRNLGLSGDALAARVEAALDEFGLRERAEHPPAALSFSARRRVALASIAAMQTPILVLDEPTVGLDARGQAQVLDWLAARHRAGCTVLLVTHDMEAAAAYAGRMLVMHQGRVLADGPPAALFPDEGLLQRAGLRRPFFSALAQALNQPELARTPTLDGFLNAWLERAP